MDLLRSLSEQDGNSLHNLVSGNVYSPALCARFQSSGNTSKTILTVCDLIAMIIAAASGDDICEQAPDTLSSMLSEIEFTVECSSQDNVRQTMVVDDNKPRQNVVMAQADLPGVITEDEAASVLSEREARRRRRSMAHQPANSHGQYESLALNRNRAVRIQDDLWFPLHPDKDAILIPVCELDSTMYADHSIRSACITPPNNKIRSFCGHWYRHGNPAHTSLAGRELVFVALDDVLKIHAMCAHFVGKKSLKEPDIVNRFTAFIEQKHRLYRQAFQLHADYLVADAYKKATGLSWWGMNSTPRADFRLPEPGDSLVALAVSSGSVPTYSVSSLMFEAFQSRYHFDDFVSAMRTDGWVSDYAASDSLNKNIANHPTFKALQDGMAIYHPERFANEADGVRTPAYAYKPKWLRKMVDYLKTNQARFDALVSAAGGIITRL